MLSPYKIKWMNSTSLDMDCWTELSFGGNDGETETYLSKEAMISESYNGGSNKIHGYKWSEPFTFSVTLIKQDYSDFTSEENRKMLKWLTSSSNASFVDIYMDDSEAIEWSALGNWVNVSQYKLGNGRIVGYIAEWESATPWALSPLYTITKDVSDPLDNKITINLETDDPQNAVYPRITIQQDSTTNIISINHAMGDTDNWVEGSVFKNINNNTFYWVDAKGEKHTSITDSSGFNTTSVSIKNTYTDDNENVTVFDTLVKNNTKGEKVVLDGANRVVSNYVINDSGKETLGNRIFGDDFSWNWTPLYEGKNELSFVCNCTVTVEYRYPIKCGEF